MRSRSPWNLLLVPFAAAGFLLASGGQFALLWLLHTRITPEHAGRIREVMGVQGRAIPQLLITLPCLFTGIPLGLMLADGLAWSIPPLRRILDRETEGVARASFRASLADLGRIARFACPQACCSGPPGPGRFDGETNINLL